MRSEVPGGEAKTHPLLAPGYAGVRLTDVAVLGEAALFTLAFITAALLFQAEPGAAFERNSVGLTAFAMSMTFLLVKRVDLIGSTQGMGGLRESLQASLRAILAVIALLTIIFPLIEFSPGLTFFSGLVGLLSGMVCVVAVDYLTVRQCYRSRSWQFAAATRRVALLGSRDACTALMDEFREGEIPVRFLGVFDPSAITPDRDTRGVGAKRLADLLREGAVDEVVLVADGINVKDLVPVVEQLLLYPVDITLFPGLVGRAVASVACPSGVLGVPLLPLVRQPTRGWTGTLKRLVDLLLGTIGLALLAPVFIVIAAAIKLESRGPVFFRQLRTGYNQEVFEVWKFRTMRWNANGTIEPLQQARRNDGRVTRLGRVLRRLSIDELPQLFNVIKGQMSLVGPRPHPLELNARFAPVLPLYAARHRVLPGITGLAQIRGCRGETDTVEKMAKRLYYDLEYIKNWSLALDVKILLDTILGKFTSPNAY